MKGWGSSLAVDGSQFPCNFSSAAVALGPRQLFSCPGLCRQLKATAETCCLCEVELPQGLRLQSCWPHPLPAGSEPPLSLSLKDTYTRHSRLANLRLPLYRSCTVVAVDSSIFTQSQPLTSDFDAEFPTEGAWAS